MTRLEKVNFKLTHLLKRLQHIFTNSTTITKTQYDSYMMNTHDVNKKKFKRPIQRTLSTTNPGTSTARNTQNSTQKSAKPLYPLLAKDSEWVDILQTPLNDSSLSSSDVSDEEEVLQLVDCEDGPEMKPLAIMFPGLLQKDPQTLQGILNRAISTTEVTRHLVDLGQKANFTFMKKANRLIPRDKQWLESLTENSNSFCSLDSGLLSYISMNYEADAETDDEKYRTPQATKEAETADNIICSPPLEGSAMRRGAEANSERINANRNNTTEEKAPQL